MIKTDNFEDLSSRELVKLLSDGIKKLMEVGGDSTTFSQEDFDSRLKDLVELEGDWKEHLEWFSLALMHTIREIKCDKLMKVFSIQFFASLLKELGFTPPEDSNETE